MVHAATEGAVVMKYINQLEHRDIPYEHNLDHGGLPEEKRNVAAGRLRSELSDA